MDTNARIHIHIDKPTVEKSECRRSEALSSNLE